jgi:hypothetical protein
MFTDPSVYGILAVMVYHITIDPDYIRSLKGELVDINPKLSPAIVPYWMRSVLITNIVEDSIKFVTTKGREDSILMECVMDIIPSSEGPLPEPEPYMPTPAQWKKIYPHAMIAKWGGICSVVIRGPDICRYAIHKGQPIVKLRQIENTWSGGKKWLVAHAWCAKGEKMPIIERDPPFKPSSQKIHGV